MNIARNMETLFVAAALLAVSTAGATAAVPAARSSAPVMLDGVVHTVVVSAPRLPQDTLLAAAK